MKQEDESQAISLIKDLQKQLTYLEKKIDTLIKQSSERTPATTSFSRGPQTSSGPKNYNNTRENRFGSKNTRSGSGFYDKKKQKHSSRVIPRKNQTFDPNTQKGLDKSK